MQCICPFYLFFTLIYSLIIIFYDLYNFVVPVLLFAGMWAAIEWHTAQWTDRATTGYQRINGACQFLCLFMSKEKGYSILLMHQSLGLCLSALHPLLVGS